MESNFGAFYPFILFYWYIIYNIKKQTSITIVSAYRLTFLFTYIYTNTVLRVIMRTVYLQCSLFFYLYAISLKNNLHVIQIKI